MERTIEEARRNRQVAVFPTTVPVRRARDRRAQVASRTDTRKERPPLCSNARPRCRLSALRSHSNFTMHAQRMKGHVRSSCALAALVAALSLVAIATFLYAIVGVLLPARELRRGVEAECEIRRARLSCWRRKPFSFTHMERGHYSCWHFGAARAGPNISGLDPATQNASDVAAYNIQYSPVYAFPEARDGCDSFAACGNTTWPCTVLPSRPGVARLRWTFPTQRLVVNLVVSTCCLLALVLTAVQRCRSKQAEQASGKDSFSSADADVEGGSAPGPEGEDSSDLRTVWSAQLTRVAAPGAPAAGTGGHAFSPEMTTSDILRRVDVVPGYLDRAVLSSRQVGDLGIDLRMAESRSDELRVDVCDCSLDNECGSQ
jgi:hypothetical protein